MKVTRQTALDMVELAERCLRDCGSKRSASILGFAQCALDDARWQLECFQYAKATRYALDSVRLTEGCESTTYLEAAADLRAQARADAFADALFGGAS